MKTSCSFRPAAPRATARAVPVTRAAEEKELLLERLGQHHLEHVGLAGMELDRADGVGLQRPRLREFLRGDLPGGLGRGGGLDRRRFRRGRGSGNDGGPGGSGRLLAARRGPGRSGRRGGSGGSRAAEAFEDAFERNLLLQLAHLDQRHLEDDILGQGVAEPAFEMAQLLEDAEGRTAGNERGHFRQHRAFGRGDLPFQRRGGNLVDDEIAEKTEQILAQLGQVLARGGQLPRRFQNGRDVALAPARARAARPARNRSGRKARGRRPPRRGRRKS